jgi:Uma2 family endonuclease
MALTIQLPVREGQTDFNIRRWDELQQDMELASLPYRIETDRFGRIIMSPPPASNHTKRVAGILRHLHDLFNMGSVMAETAVSTGDGVKVTDAAWLAPGRVHELDESSCLIQAPEICIEVLSPSNSQAEMNEKRVLYFQAGAAEVWICDLEGRMTFFVSGEYPPVDRSLLCASFPPKV